jgi:hypothetical protein
MREDQCLTVRQFSLLKIMSTMLAWCSSYLYMFDLVSCENRSPGLALVLSTALLLSADAFWLQQILKLSDAHLSCSFVVWITYATYPTILLASVFRYV